MVEVASSNLAGPTKFLSRCFSSKLFFFFAESSRVLVSYLYPGKVVLGKPLYPRELTAHKKEVSKRSLIGTQHAATGTR